MWALQELAPDSGAALVSRAWRISGQLNVAQLRQAAQQLVTAHDALRSCLVLADGCLQVEVAASALVDFETRDLRQKPADLDAQIAECRRLAFAPEASSLMRLRLYQIGAQDWVLLLVHHHAVLDGWSVTRLLEDLRRAYGAPNAALTPPSYGWGGYLSDLSAADLSEAAAPQPGELEPLQLPYDYERRGTDLSGQALWLHLSAAERQGIEALAADLHVGAAAVLMAAWRLTLARISGQAEFALGTVLFGRNAPEVQSLLGGFVQTANCQVSLRSGMTFGQLCQAEQGASADLLGQEGTLDGDLSRDSFQATFNYRGYPTRGLTLEGCNCEEYVLEAQTAAFPLGFNVEPDGAGYAIELLWQRACFQEETVARIAAEFREVLTAGLAQSQAAIWPLRLSEAERDARLLHGDSGFWASRQGVVPVRAQLERAFEVYKGSVALRHGDLEWDYADLDRHSALWAHSLTQRNLGPGDLVAIALPRGPAFLAAVIGTFRAGCAFVPLSPEDPPHRLVQMLRHAQPKVLIAEVEMGAELNALLAQSATGRDTQELAVLAAPDAAETVMAAKDFAHDLAPDTLAYVMFTSGSSGTPKGVAVSFDALSAQLCVQSQVFKLRPKGRFLSGCSVTFDVVLLEWLLPLIAGSELVMLEDRYRRDPWKIVEMSEERHFDVLSATPTLWQMLLNAGLRGHDRLTMLTGGETLPASIQNELLQRTDRLLNGYGPTEATVATSMDLIDEPAELNPTHAATASSVGHVLPGYLVAVVDPEGQPVWPGQMGEIWVHGQGLALGYHNDPVRSAVSFPKDPPGLPKGRWYRTGDLGRVLPDGRLGYAGRIDAQVKISGQRIELGEVEAAAIASGLLKAAGAYAFERQGRQTLAMHIVPASDTPVGTLPESLREDLLRHLRRALPATWVPSHLFEIAALPVNSAGKLDRRALQNLCREGLRNAEAAPDAAATTVEIAPEVQQAWTAALGTAPVAADADFFDLGGNSAQFIGLLAALREQTKAHLPVDHAFERPTPAALTDLLREEKRLSLPDPLVVARQGDVSATTKTPLVFVPGVLPISPNLVSLLQMLPQDQSVYQFHRKTIPYIGPLVAFADHTKHYAQIADEVFGGTDIHVCGFSHGGGVAVETVRALQALGHRPQLTILDHGLGLKVQDRPDFLTASQQDRANCLRIAHHFHPVEGDIAYFRSSGGLYGMSMLAKGWEDYASGTVTIYTAIARHSNLLTGGAKDLADAVQRSVPALAVLHPQPGAGARREVAHLIADNKPDAAFDQLRALVEAYPLHPWQAGCAYRLADDLGRGDEGRAVLRRWLARAPRSVPEGVEPLCWHTGRAHAYEKLGQHVRCFLALKRARKECEPTYDLEVNYARKLLYLRQVRAAQKVLEAAQAKWGSEAQLELELGICYAQQGRFEEALALFYQALEVWDDNTRLRLWIKRAERRETRWRRILKRR